MFSPETAFGDLVEGGGEGNFGDVCYTNVIENCLAKRFKDGGVYKPKKGHQAAHLVGLFNLATRVRPSNWHVFSSRLSWVVGLIGNSEDSIDGVVIPKASEDHYIRYRALGVETKHARDLSFLLGDYLNKRAIEVLDPTLHQDRTTGRFEVGFEDRIEICFELLTTMQFLWSQDLCYSDFSFKNILWTLKPVPNIYVIDTDSIIDRNDSTRGNNSPGWKPNETLDKLGQDRALVALAIWRILSDSPIDYPDMAQKKRFLNHLSDSQCQALVDVWSTGSPKGVNAIREWLMQMRNPSYASTKFESAHRTGWARLVLAYVPASPTDEEAKVVECASAQLALEQELESLSPFARRARLRRESSIRGFDFDLVPESNHVDLSSEGWTIREMALSGRYQELAEIASQGAFGSAVPAIAIHSVVMALAGNGELDISERRRSEDVIQVEWQWSGWSPANLVRTRIVSDTDEVLAEQVFHRDRVGASIIIHREGLPHRKLKLAITTGSDIPEHGPVFGVTQQHIDLWGAPRPILAPLTSSTREFAGGGRPAPDSPPQTRPDHPPRFLPIAPLRPSLPPQPRMATLTSVSPSTPRRNHYLVRILKRIFK